MNLGTVGFLMNDWRLDRLAERIEAAKAIRVAPLEMTARTVGGDTFTHAAINEVSLLRETRQTANLSTFEGRRPSSSTGRWSKSFPSRLSARQSTKLSGAK